MAGETVSGKLARGKREDEFRVRWIVYGEAGAAEVAVVKPGLDEAVITAHSPVPLPGFRRHAKDRGGLFSRGCDVLEGECWAVADARPLKTRWPGTELWDFAGECYRMLLGGLPDSPSSLSRNAVSCEGNVSRAPSGGRNAGPRSQEPEDHRRDHRRS